MDGDFAVREGLAQVSAEEIYRLYVESNTAAAPPPAEEVSAADPAGGGMETSAAACGGWQWRAQGRDNAKWRLAVNFCRPTYVCMFAWYVCSHGLERSSSRVEGVIVRVCAADYTCTVSPLSGVSCVC